MLKLREVAERLRISLACAYALVETKKLAHYRIGVGRGAIRVTEEQLAAFLASREQGPSTPSVRVTVKPLKNLSLE